MPLDRPQLVAVTPTLPRPPGDLPRNALDWGNQLVRALEGFIRLQTGTPMLRGAGLFLPGLPTSEYGLFPDQVFANNGVLTLVRADVVHVAGMTITSHIGHQTTSP